MERTLLLERLHARRPRWVRFARRWTGSQADAEELFDAAIARLHTAAMPPEAELDRWFGRVLRNAAVDALRRRTAERRALERWGQEPFDAEPAARACGCIPQAAAGLKPAYAEVIAAVHAQEMPIGAFAARAGLTVNNATVRLHRARRALKERVVARCGACADDGCRDCDCAEGRASL